MNVSINFSSDQMNYSKPGLYSGAQSQSQRARFVCIMASWLHFVLGTMIPNDQHLSLLDNRGPPIPIVGGSVIRSPTRFLSDGIPVGAYRMRIFLHVCHLLGWGGVGHSHDAT